MVASQNSLKDSLFVDLHIGGDFADVKGLAGVNDSRVPVPDGWAEEVDALRNLCKKRMDEIGIPEFSIVHGDVVFRVTHLDGLDDFGVYALRRSNAQLREPHTIGLPGRVVEALLSENAHGVVLICGEMGAGKTSTAASFVVERLKVHGGTALAIEDPTETNINGVHGKGRCIAVPASRHNGGYKEHLLRGLRSGVNFFFIGEIRDEETAFEAIKAGSNGMLIFATIHAGSAPQAIERLITLSSQYTTKAADVLADSIYAVVWQNLKTVQRQGRIGETMKILTASTLIVAGDNEGSIREKIRKQEFHALQQEIQNQAAQQLWGQKN